ncbi:glycoside hydrolase family 99-like domain-containing protein [Paenibacillus sp. FSL H8-0537]|uniref:glycoside hydrolase family 99-like domain-containing protein n=1 Tax=Paenibacillus sp. FSL H8-0537 TaxID=2921399 RepID=UPI003101152C
MKIIAFYLPQYHPVKENNEWWGNGFTEWTNVSKARPSFNGHYQPHIPSDLGFYDLRLPETREAQGELAASYGIDAFCYYHYWFNGKMILERPFNEVLQSGKPNLDFCLCWANENWSRRWDGMDQQLLLKQEYEEYSPEEHIKWLAEAFQDPRYIKIDNKPLFLVYRANEITNLQEVVAAWRNEIKKYGFDDIYLCCANNSKASLTVDDMIQAGFDSMYDFTPDFRDTANEHLSVSTIPGLTVYSYQDMVEKALQKEAETKLPAFPCVFPSWDNTARRSNNATIIQNNDASLYKHWLQQSIERVNEYALEEQIVFINAWNEWGEGCHLEPDLKNGHLFLEATKEARDGSAPDRLEMGEEAESTESLKHSVNLSVNVLRPIYIWGTGAAGLKTLELLSASSIKVEGFIDNNASKVGTLINGVTVHSKSTLSVAQQNVEPFVCIASMFHEEIENDLMAIGLLRNKDYAININQSTIRRYSAKGQPFIMFENDCFCNICGFGKFSMDTIQRCQKCGALPEERMLIEILGEELGAAGIPLSNWVSHKHVQILNLNAIQDNIPFLELIFTNTTASMQSSLNKMHDDNGYDYALVSLQRSNMDEIAVLSILEQLTACASNLIILAKDQNASNVLHAYFTQSKSNVYRVEREYRKYKTGFQYVLIINHLSINLHDN